LINSFFVSAMVKSFFGGHACGADTA